MLSIFFGNKTKDPRLLPGPNRAFRKEKCFKTEKRYYFERQKTPLTGLLCSTRAVKKWLIYNAKRDNLVAHL